MKGSVNVALIGWVEWDGVPFKFLSGFLLFIVLLLKGRVFTPEEGLNEGNTVNLDMKDYGENERDDNSFVNLEDGKDNSESVNKNSKSKHSGHSKYSVLPRTGGFILNLMEEVVKVGQTMGLLMDGASRNYHLGSLNPKSF
ncbi:hypothetical protein Tco_0983117 [Tanacetum coccineum]